MADQRTKEELLQEIINKQSANESYAKFKESLQDLTQDIDALMNPTEEGWKLLSNGKGIRYKSLKNGDLKAEYVAEITRSLRPRKLTTVRRPARTTGPVM